MCVGCLFLRTPSRAPYRTPPACANRAAYPDPPPVVPDPESIDSQCVCWLFIFKDTITASMLRRSLPFQPTLLKPVWSMAELKPKERPGLGSLSGAPVLLKQGFMQQKSMMGFKKRYFRLLQDSVCCFSHFNFVRGVSDNVCSLPV